MSRKPSKYKTTSEARIRELVAQGKTFVDIADIECVNLNQLRAAAKILGIKSAYHARTYRANVADIVSALERGETLEDIANSKGVTRQAIFGALKRAKQPTTVIAAVRAKTAREAGK